MGYVPGYPITKHKTSLYMDIPWDIPVWDIPYKSRDIPKQGYPYQYPRLGISLFLCMGYPSLAPYMDISVLVGYIPYGQPSRCTCNRTSHSKMWTLTKTLGATVIAWPFSFQQFCFEFGKNKGPK